MTDLKMIEGRLDQLAADVEQLKKTVTQLTGRGDVSVPTAATQDLDVSEDLLSWVDKASLLQRISTVSFLLVVALALRTLTDKGVLPPQVGSFVGMAYAAMILVFSWRAYRRDSSLAPILAICGSLLLGSVVVEIHTRFNSLPILPAYLTLIAMGVGMAALTVLYKVAIPGAIGVLVMCLAGIAIDFPEPNFLYLAILLVAGNLLVHSRPLAERLGWARWFVFGLTVLMSAVWQVKIEQSVGPDHRVIAGISTWAFFPYLLVLFTLYSVGCVFGSQHGPAKRLTIYNLFLPTANVVLVFGLAARGFRTLGASLVPAGIAGLVIALIYLVVGFIRSKEKYTGAGPDQLYWSDALFFAGGIALVSSALTVFGNTPAVLPIYSVLALGVVVAAGPRELIGVRLTAYLVQLYATGMLAFILSRDTSVGTTSLFKALATTVPMALLAFVQYEWMLGRISYLVLGRLGLVPPRTKGFGSVMLLIASLATSFLAVKAVMYRVLGVLDGLEMFQSFQTVIINGAAAVLLFFALRRRNPEMRNVAILVIIVGACKVFLYDMFNMLGIPLLISIFSFGVAASITSALLSRWKVVSK